MPDRPPENSALPENLDRFTLISHFVLRLTSKGMSPSVPWEQVEGKARARWEAEHPGTWDEYKEEIFQAWSNSRGPLP